MMNFLRNKTFQKTMLYFWAYYLLLFFLRGLTTAADMEWLKQQGYQILFSVLFTAVSALWNFSRQNLFLSLFVTFVWLLAALCKRWVGMVLPEREIIQTIGTGLMFYGLCAILLYGTEYLSKSILRKTLRFLIGGGFAFLMLPALLAIGYFVVSEGHLLSADILLTLFQTNYEEVKAYLVEQNMPLWAFSVCVLLVLCVVLGKLITKLQISTKNLKCFVFVILFTAYLFIGVLPRHSSCFVLNMIIHVRETLQSYKDYNTTKAIRQAHLQELRKVLKTENAAGLHVLVVGESTTRGHLGAFGYKRDTTPWLSGLLKNSSTKAQTIIYPHAYSSNISTVKSIQFALTEQNQYQDKSLSDSYSLTEIASAGGYDTYWISNQKQFNYDDIPITGIANGAAKRNYINDYIGHKTLTTFYDEKLAEYFPKHETGQKTFIIFHLMGCHAVYIDRYPSSFDIFKDGADQRVNQYDNCVHYNDYVLSLLYQKAAAEPDFMSFTFLSDHGEDPDKGLTHDFSKYTWNMPRIPFVTIFSKKYAAKHQDVIRALQANHKAYWTRDLLYNLMVHILGIHNMPSEDSRLDLASPAYAMTKEMLMIAEGTFYIKDDDIKDPDLE